MQRPSSNKKLQALIQAAEANDPQAQYDLGVAYEYGEFDVVDLAQAMRWIRRSAENGHVHAQFKLACYYESGLAGQPDDSAAYLWTERAAQQGLVHAQKQLSRLLSLGRGVARDFHQAAYWEKEFLTREAADGEAAAMHHLGNFWLEGKPGFPRDTARALRWYAEAAARGHRDAMLRLASLLEKGEAVARDEEQAIEWYERAGGEGVPAAARLRNLVRLRVLSDQGDADAKYQLGDLLGSDSDEGRDFLQQAAQMGQRDAARRLFEFYRSLDDGRGIPSAGRQWIELAAELGIPEAAQCLGKATGSQECAPAGTVDLIARLKQQAAAGDVIAEITLNSLLSSPLHAPRK